MTNPIAPRHCSGPVIASRAGQRVISCRECGFPHLENSAPPDPGYYKSEFWQKKHVGWRKIYEEQREWLDARHFDWLSMVEDVTMGRTLLDVGCGWGFFMKAAQERGWEVDGIEPNTEASEYAAELLGGPAGFFMEPWDRADKYFDHKYDCISALWLIEHLHNPCEFLDWCRRNLYGGGVLLLALPNEWNSLQFRANARAAVKDYFVDSTHINYFSQAHIAYLLGLHGFRVVDSIATYPMEKFLLDGLDYTANASLGQALHAAVRFADTNMDPVARREMYRQLARAGVGRDVVVVAKPE